MNQSPAPLLSIIEGLEPRLLETLSTVHIAFDGTRAEARLSFFLYGPPGIGKLEGYRVQVDAENLPQGVTMSGIERYPDLVKEVALAPSMEDQIRALNASGLVGGLDAVRLDAGIEAVQQGHAPASWIIKTHAATQEERTAWVTKNTSSGLAGVTTYDRKEGESPMNYPIKQPPRPPKERLAAMTAIMIEAGRAHRDIGEILVASLHTAADALGDVEALVAGRPGSWEAEIVRRMASAPVGSRDVQRDKKYIQRLVPLFIEMGKAGEDGGDVLSQAMGPAVDELGGLAEFAGNSTYWSHDLINIGRQYSKHWDDDIY